MATPLAEFDSPRKFQNADGTQINASGVTKLGEDLIAERVPSNPAPGELTYLLLRLNGDGPLSQQVISALEAIDEATATPTASKIAKYDASARLSAASFLVGTGTPGDISATGAGNIIVTVPYSVAISADSVSALQVSAGETRINNYTGGNLKIGADTQVDDTAGVTTISGGTTLVSVSSVKFVTASMGFYNTDPVARPAAFTQTYSTASRTLADYVADAETSAYIGINGLVGTNCAAVVDLNALRVAYENLRAHHESLAQVVNQILDDLQLMGLLE